MTEAYFSEIEKHIVANCATATTLLHIAVAWFTNPKIFALINHLHDKGVKIKVIVADDRINFTLGKKYFKKMLDRGIELRTSLYPNLMHHKFCIIDDKILITGSYNWTKNAETKNIENIILTTERSLLNKYNKEFARLCDITDRISKIESVKIYNYGVELENIEYILLKEEKEEIIIIENDNQSDNDSFDKILDSLLKKAEYLYLTGEIENSIDICNKILAKNSKIADAYELISRCKWRKNEFREQIKFATQAIEIDNKFYNAFNMLGIGYSHVRNIQKSIENYNICIAADPDYYIYYLNRALSYSDLVEDDKIPNKLREQFKVKAINDFQEVIHLINRIESKSKGDYATFYSRGTAKLHLKQKYTIDQAKTDLVKAKDLYKSTSKKDKDIHDIREINKLLRNIEKVLKNN